MAITPRQMAVIAMVALNIGTRAHAVGENGVKFAPVKLRHSANCIVFTWFFVGCVKILFTDESVHRGT